MSALSTVSKMESKLDIMWEYAWGEEEGVSARGIVEE